jgi:hypothetical protein
VIAETRNAKVEAPQTDPELGVSQALCCSRRGAIWSKTNNNSTMAGGSRVQAAEELPCVLLKERDISKEGGGECVKGKVSFVVPCYKLAHLLAKYLDSILTQTYTKLEVIVRDDSSPDHTAAVASSFRDSRVKYIRNEKNRLSRISWGCDILEINVLKVASP